MKDKRIKGLTIQYLTFHVKWAIKNLIVNKRRTLKKVSSMAFPLAIIFISIVFLAGTGKQMEQSLYYSYGDLSAESRLPENNITKVFNALKLNVSSDDDVFQEYDLKGKIYGLSGFENISIKGTEPSYLPYFSHAIGWEVEPSQNMARGTALLEAFVAARIKAKVGDYVTIEIKSKEGFINTVQLKVDGIFMGNQYLYSDVVLINIEDARELSLDNNGLNQVRTFIRNISDERGIESLASKLEQKYFSLASFTTRSDLRKNYVFQIFVYYRIALIVILSIVILSFIIILNFSIQNIYYIEYRSRRKEISTLLTFGMKPFGLALVVFFESLFSFIFATLIAFLVTFVIGFLCSSYQIHGLKIQELIAMLGGNHLVFSYNPHVLMVVITIMFFISIRASRQGTKKYLKMHIREITTSTRK